VIRAGMLKLGCGVLGELLSADRGHRGPAVPCGNGHEAVFASYRGKVIDTVLGPVTLNRAWYHCKTCKHGLAPRDAELGVAGTSLSPGLTAMNDKAAAAGPFAGAASMREDLAGARLTVKRTERAAEASGAAHAAQVRGQAMLIADRKVVPMPPRPVPDMLYGVIDGTGVPMTARETVGREFPFEGVKKEQAEKELGYFLNNAPRMRHRWFRSRGLFVGSGVVEAGCKSIVAQRLKQAGMHWTTDGADAIIALRCREASGQWEAICNTPHTQTRAG
jgi:hypothetical protein